MSYGGALKSQFVIPTEEEMHQEYRRIHGPGFMFPEPVFYTFKGDRMDQDLNWTYDRHKIEHVILLLDETLQEIHFDGDRIVSIPSVDVLSDPVFAGIAKINKSRSLIISVELLQNLHFVEQFIENKWRFRTITIWNPNNLDIKVVHRTKRLFPKRRYKATSKDVKKEFRERLGEIYAEIFGCGIGYFLCIYTLPIGVAMLTIGIIALPIDAVVSGIRYAILKIKEK